MKRAMKVSIVIPNYNGEKFLKKCLDSITVQTFRDFELIVVDNASADQSLSILEAYPDPVRLFRLDKNEGFSKAVNVGIKAARGEYVVLLNNDTEAEPEWLSALVQSMAEHPEYFSVCSKMLQFRQRSLLDDAGDEYNILGWAYKRGDGKPEKTYGEDGNVFSACAGAAIYRRSVFDLIGFFDEQFFAYMEDVDLSYRARIFGYQNGYCSKARIYHVGSGTSGSRYNDFKVRLAARNNLFVVYKNMPVLQLLVNSPFLMAGFLVKYAFFRKKGYGKAFGEGFREGLRECRRLDKMKFRWGHLGHYFRIEGLLIQNLFRYVGIKLLDKTQ